MSTEKFKEVPYTIEVDWENGTVLLNNHISKEKIVLTKKDSESIASSFKLIEAKQKELF